MNRDKFFACQDGSIEVLHNNYLVKINDKIKKISICEIDIPIEFNDSQCYDEICENAINYLKKEILHDNVA